MCYNIGRSQGKNTEADHGSAHKLSLSVSLQDWRTHGIYWSNLTRILGVIIYNLWSSKSKRERMEGYEGYIQNNNKRTDIDSKELVGWGVFLNYKRETEMKDEENECISTIL